MIAELEKTAALSVGCVTDDAGFDALEESWNRLSESAGNIPLLTWDWLRSSWQHFRSEGSQLFILTVRGAAGELVGLAPWYRKQSSWQGNVVRFLGSDEACSDYLSLLAAPQFENDVARTVAEWLDGEAAGQWDLIELDGVDANDRMIGLLAVELRRRNNTVHSRPGESCWRLQLPNNWDEYLSRLSKNRRKKIKPLLRKTLDCGAAELLRAHDEESLKRGLEILADLHERRRVSLGEAGCFSRERFPAFLFDVARRLHARGMLRLQWIELEGTPIAVDFDLSNSQCIFGYQCGINPDFSKLRPGTLMMAVNFRQAILDGYTEFDFLRGDEEYKSRWKADQKPSQRIRIVPPRALARTKHGLWLSGTTIKQWMKESRRRLRLLRSTNA